MMSNVLKHVQRNAIAYVALFFAIGGGGAGAAIAATAVSSGTIHACVSKTTGALYVAKRCSSSERALSFNQRGPAGPAGQGGPSAFGQVDGTGKIVFERGMTITQTSTGFYSVDITASSCKHSKTQIPSLTPYGLGAVQGFAGSQPGNVQPAVNEAATTGPRSFNVIAGYIGPNGTFIGTDQGFTIYDECVEAS